MTGNHPTTRRAYMAGVAGIILVGLAGCSSQPPDENPELSIEKVQVVKQATRVGVRVTIDNSQFAGTSTPVRVELYNDSGEVVRTGYLAVGTSGGATDAETLWFEFDDINATREIYSANADKVSKEEFNQNVPEEEKIV